MREDVLLPLVERFFRERIFGPMRMDKLARQLRSHQRQAAKRSNRSAKRLRDEIADLDDRITKQVEALEAGVEPEVVRKRIEKLRADKEAAEVELRALAPAWSIRSPRRTRERSWSVFRTWAMPSSGRLGS